MGRILKLKIFLKSKLSFFFEAIINLFGKILVFLKSNFNVFFSWLVLVTIVLIFQNKIATFLAENSIIKHVDVKKQSFNLAFVTLVLIFLIRFFWFIVKNYRISQKQNYFIFLFSSIYFFLRNDENDSLYFSYLSRRHELYYSDIILLIAILSILLIFRNIFLRNWSLYDNIVSWFDELIKKGEHVKSSFLIEDIPLNNTNINDNEKVIDEVVKAVINLKPSYSFIIGINSIWGIGKTSFLKRLEYKLTIQKIHNESKPITFWFNAWQHQDEKSIINNFFNQLKKELSVFSGDSENSIDNYLKEMLALADNKYLNFFKSITDSIFSNGDSIKESYDEINVIIEEINRKIIVFVDDIDRLNKVEILETLRILRNIANFKNVVFVCGFDREYVVKQSQIDNHYLDKIFNLEINLTTQNQKGFVSFFSELINSSSGYDNDEKNILIESVNKIFYADEESSIDISSLIKMTRENNTNQEGFKNEEVLAKIPLIPSFFFESRRDVKKFYNELYINFKTLGSNISDINLEKYLLLKLLLFKYKWMHKNFASKRINSWLGSEPVLRFKELNLKKLLLNKEIENQDSYIIFSVLLLLFPENGLHNHSPEINQKRYFPIYFSNNVFNECLTYYQLTDAIKNNRVKKLLTDIVNGKENERSIINDIKLFLLKPENIDNINEYKQVVDLIKNGDLGKVDEMKILNFLHLGEKNFGIEYKKLLAFIFTNFEDPFGSFALDLSIYYRKYPLDSSRNKYKLEDGIDHKTIDALKILNKEVLKKLNLVILRKEINAKNLDTKMILSNFNRFYEIYFTDLKFGFFYEEYKVIIKGYMTENFENIFLANNVEKTISDMDTTLLTNLFENDIDKKEFVEVLKMQVDGKVNGTSKPMNGIIYREGGLNNFIKYVEDIENLISPEKIEIYKEFLVWLHTFRDNFYLGKPTTKEVSDFKNGIRNNVN